jgi:hypothetical protein
LIISNNIDIEVNRDFNSIIIGLVSKFWCIILNVKGDRLYISNINHS